MSEDEAFLAAVRANPADDTVRLVYADWLDERGDPRADFLRLDCHLRGLSADDSEYQNHQRRLNELARALERRWLATVCRIQVELDGTARASAAWDSPFAGWTVSAGGVSATGGYRERNEDLIVFDPVNPTAIVLDGMGSDPAGQRAAAVGGEALRRALAGGPTAGEPADEFIRRALRTANEAVRGLVNENPNFRNAGTTAVLATLRDGRVYVSWAGDSMAYRVSLDSVECLTWAHTLREALWRQGVLSEEEARHGRMSNALWQYLGGELADPIEVPTFVPRPGDRVILTTDGVHAWPEPQFVAACRLHPNPLACAEHLVGAALEGGTRDNATCVVIAFDGPTRPPPEPRARRPWWRFWDRA